MKKSLIATERRRKRVRAARYEWRHRRMPRMRLEPHRLVFIDETAVTTKMTRLRGRAPLWCAAGSGRPVRAFTARQGIWKMPERGRTQTFIAELRVDELAAPWLLDGPMNRAAFDAYVETQLAPVLQPGDL